jgi:hypothetical protein
MNKRAFYVDKNGQKISYVYRKLTLRNRYILWNLKRDSIPVNAPDGFWIVTLERNGATLPGLLFREA